MKLKSLSNDPQYTDAGLEEAYHIVYYIPKGYTDTTKWTSMIKQFKWNKNDENDQYIYRHPDGSIRAFESDLYLYARFVEIFTEGKTTQVDTGPLWKLRDSLLAKGDLLLSEIVGIKDTVSICKDILTKIKAIESRKIIEILKEEITQNS